MENYLYEQNPQLLAFVNKSVVKLTQNVERNLKRNYIKKLRWIFRMQNIKPNKSGNTHITAWDNIVPPQCILEALDYGPLYAPPPLPKPETFIPDIELVIKGMNETNQDFIRWKTRFRATKEVKSNGSNTRRFRNIIKNSRHWLQQNNIVLMKADKSKGVVLLKQSTYNEKLREYIASTECQPAPVHFLETLQQRVKRFTSTPLARLLHMQNSIIRAPREPRIFAFAKTHKPGYQIRPVIEKCNSPTFLIEKQLVKFFQSKAHRHPFSINNSLQLIEDLKNISLMDDEYMTVLDFKSMYPSIKLSPCFCALRDFLFANVENATHHHNQILELAHLVCYTSFFEFENKLYLQGRGVPMGSPTSAILCELVLRQLENKILPEFQHLIILYARYVDDIFIL
ncbi:uncharacterized protein LOC111622945 [Centruroides sculpturatus]|uniref:uncharacterized protein LOC111622945 n=1 Tax=Centruroides sculpturatus TaxID=218467 RepID=UPI000C6E8E51|nr:uncharacterized protein LOC111622945 [Centruroides sculpturatus]